VPPVVDPALKVRLTEAGIEFDRVLSYDIDSDYFTSTDGFSFTLYDEDQSKVLGFELEPVELAIDGAPQLIGRIDDSDIGDNSAITYSGRDYIADLVECNIDPSVVVKKGDSLFNALTLAACPVGIDVILSDNDVAMRDVRSGKALGAKPIWAFPETKAEDFKPDPGEGIYEFCNRLVCRFGATIQPGANRNELLVTAPNDAQDPAFSITVTRDSNNAANNNAYNCRAHRSFASMPTYAVFQGRGATPGKLQSGLSSEYATALAGSALSDGFFNEIGRELITRASFERRKPAPGTIFGPKLYRFLFHRDTASRNQEQLDHALLRAVSERIKETLVYTCTMRGHRDPFTGVIYSVDTLCDVKDDIRNVHEVMWVAARKFRYAEGTGAETDLKMYRKRIIQL
jgi:hypothetical protein